MDAGSSVAFLCYWSAVRHPLHSFPTRRSSDLVCPCRVDCAYRDIKGPKDQGGHHGDQRHRQQDLDQGKPALRTRSEEHTSELQSRRDLVCRLLLEKKKRTSRDTVEPSKGSW